MLRIEKSETKKTVVDGDLVSKSNFRAEAVQDKANLPGTSTTIVQFVLQVHNKTIFDLGNEGQLR